MQTQMSVEQFLKLLGTSQVFTPDEVAQLVKSLCEKADAEAPRVDKLAKWLVTERRISPYQAKILLSGKPGPFVYGPYRIYDRIESGRLAGIFRAVHIATRRPVCLYFLAGAKYQDPKLLHSLAQQTTAANRATVGHPHLLRTFHLVEEKKFKFIVVEDLQGKRLERLLATKGALAPAEACRIARQAALGLGRLHAMGRAHGEIRPANIWLQTNGQVKLLLFPLARDPLMPSTEELIASASKETRVPPEADYLAPELTTGSQMPDARSDIYSLGCTLYHALAYQPPFPDGDFQQKLERHRSEEPRPLTEIVPEIPPALAKLVRYMMAKDPDLRYQAANSVVEALLPHIATGDAESQPEPPSKRAQAYEHWLAKHLAATQPATVAEPAAEAPAPATAAPAAPPAKAAVVAKAAAVQLAATAMPAALASPAVPRAAIATAIPAGPTAMPVAATAMPAVAVAVPAGGAVRPGMAVPAAVAMTAHGHAPFPAAIAHAEIAFDMDGDDAPSSTPRRRSRRSSSGKFISLGLGLLMLGGVGGGYYYMQQQGLVPSINDIVEGKTEKFDTRPGHTSGPENPPPVVAEEEKAPPAEPEAKEKLWAVSDKFYNSPTEGKPVNLKYLAPGSQAVAILRPAELLKHEEGAKLLDERVSGELGKWLTTRLPTLLGGTKLEAVDQLIVGLLDSPQGELRPAVVAYLSTPVTAEAMNTAWGETAEEKIGESAFHKKDDKEAWYLPEAAAGKIVVVSPVLEMRDVVSTDGNSALLPLPLEALLHDWSDEERTFTFAVGPALISDEGRELLVGHTGKLRLALDWFLTGYDSAAPSGSDDEELPRAMLLSCKVGETFFGEVRIASPTAGQFHLNQGQGIATRLKQLQKDVNKTLLGLNITPYSSNILIEFPDRIEALADYTRVAVGEHQIVMRTYLPPTAPHNLLLGAYLMLLENPRGMTAEQIAAQTAAAKPKTGPAEALQKKVTITFDRNPLEKAVAILSDEIGMPIIIRGSELQIDGITKNQSMGLDEQNQPALDILKKIMQKANPDGKLVYIFQKGTEGGDEIWLTTWQAVEKNKWEVPGGQQPPGAAAKKK